MNDNGHIHLSTRASKTEGAISEGLFVGHFFVPWEMREQEERAYSFFYFAQFFSYTT